MLIFFFFWLLLARSTKLEQQTQSKEGNTKAQYAIALLFFSKTKIVWIYV